MSFSSGVMDDLGAGAASVGAVGDAGWLFGMGAGVCACAVAFDLPEAGAPALAGPDFDLLGLASASSVALTPPFEAMMIFSSGSVKRDSSSTVMRTLPEVRS